MGGKEQSPGQPQKHGPCLDQASGVLWELIFLTNCLWLRLMSSSESTFSKKEGPEVGQLPGAGQRGRGLLEKTSDLSWNNEGCAHLARPVPQEHSGMVPRSQGRGLNLELLKLVLHVLVRHKWVGRGSPHSCTFSFILRLGAL